MENFEKFKENNLPDEKYIFNSLKNCSIWDEEYLRAIDISNIFNIKHLVEYHDLYLKTDVLLLCDVFEKFINVCLMDNGLDPCHYFSSPRLAWDAMLKMTGIKLEKINDVDMYLLLEKGMRGRISYISKRYSKSNDDIDVMYLDMSNLYGWAMECNYHPYEGFKWLNKFDVFSIKENSNIGYILEVDLEYCKELHDIHNDYLLCPEHISINYDMLSNYCKNIVDKYNIKVVNNKKLIPNLYDKVKYIVRYKNLQYCLKLGMKLIKIHRILSFKHKNWLKTFTDFDS